MSAARELSLFAAVAALVCGATPAAALPPLMVELGYGDQVATSRTFDLVSTQDHLSGFQLSVAVRPLERWSRLWLEVSEFYGATSADLHGLGTAGLSFHEIGVSAFYRRELIGPLSWYAKAGPRVAVGQLNLDAPAGNPQLGEWAGTVGLGGALGLEAALDISGHDGATAASFGLRLEAGYVWFPDLTYGSLQAPKASPPAGQQPITSTAVAIGDLNLSGIHWGLTGFARF